MQTPLDTLATVSFLGWVEEFFSDWKEIEFVKEVLKDNPVTEEDRQEAQQALEIRLIGDTKASRELIEAHAVMQKMLYPYGNDKEFFSEEEHHPFLRILSYIDSSKSPEFFSSMLEEAEDYILDEVVNFYYLQLQQEIAITSFISNLIVCEEEALADLGYTDDFKDFILNELLENEELFELVFPSPAINTNIENLVENLVEFPAYGDSAVFVSNELNYVSLFSFGD